MEVTRAPQGLDAEDRVALGLSAAHLFYLVVFSMLSWATFSSALPLVVRAPLGCLFAACGCALAWGRAEGRPIDRWVVLYVAYRLRPRGAVEADPPIAVADRPVHTPQPKVAVESITAAAVNSVPRSRHSETRPAPGISHRARRVAFHSHSGGSGKTTLALESATLLALRGVRVALVDCHPATTTMRIRSGLDGPGLGDLLRTARVDGPAFERVLLRHPGGARVVLAQERTDDQGEWLRSPAVAVAGLLEHLDGAGFECVIVDIGDAPSENVPCLGTFDAVYSVFTPTCGGVFSLYGAVAGLRRAGLRRQIRLVVNHHDGRVDLEEVLGDLRVSLAASIPTLPSLLDAEKTHFAGVLADGVVAEALMPLVEDMYPETRSSWFFASPRHPAVGQRLP